MENKVKGAGYDRTKVTPGILHIGAGNFHRAHEEFYTNRLLALDAAESGWGIVGAMLMPQDEKLYRALKEQQGRYTLTVCGRDGKDCCHEIDSLLDVKWAVTKPEEVLELIADPRIKIISLTITEGGYNIDKESGLFDLSNKEVEHDIHHPREPRTVFGYVAEGLRRRINSGAGPVTIMTCDNLQKNGDTARHSFMTFFEAQDPRLAAWASEFVTFPKSMVDRITPATTAADVERLNAANGTDDKAPVYCEDFIQWVIEDTFAAGRPKWEKVGVQFTDRVEDYEHMKLSLLNASHTLLSYPAFLAGYRKVDAAMRDVAVRRFVEQFMDIDVTPYVPAPEGIDLEEYKRTLVERFANRSVADQVSRLCFDGLSKFPVYVTPTLTRMVADGKDLTRVAYLLAAYRHYLKYHRDDSGQEFEVAEPWMNPEDQSLIDSPDPIEFLGLSAFAGAGLKDSPEFKKPYMEFVESIKNNGAMATLKTIVS